MTATTSDDFSDPNNLKATHSIEAILGMKNGETHYFPPHHHQQRQQQQHLLSSQLILSTSELQQQNKKRYSDTHYPNSKDFVN